MASQVASRSVGVVGLGRLGGALAHALKTHGLLWGVAGHGARVGEPLPAELGSGAYVSAADLVAGCDVVFLTVPDGALQALADSLPFRAGQWVVHCSGALECSVLAGATRRGALGGCLHPLQSFPGGTGGAARFADVVCGVEGPTPLIGWLEGLVRALGAEPLHLAGVDRAAYHTAAVFASNYLVALYVAAARSFELAGLPAESARAALLPLSQGTLDNLRSLPAAQALTGPVARGDVQTVEGHLQALQGDGALRQLYRGLGAALLRLPLGLGARARDRLKALLG